MIGSKLNYYQKIKSSNFKDLNPMKLN